jgi:transglutaminase-like putative cysteine protease
LDELLQADLVFVRTLYHALAVVSVGQCRNLLRAVPAWDCVGSVGRGSGQMPRNVHRHAMVQQKWSRSVHSEQLYVRFRASNRRTKPCIRCRNVQDTPGKRGLSVLIKSEYDIQFHLPQQTTMVAMLHVHPSIEPLLTTPDRTKVEHIGPQPGMAMDAARELPVEEYLDGFGNRCSRFVAPAGAIRLSGTNTLRMSDFPAEQGFGLPWTPVEQLPPEVLQFLLASRYCEVDKFGGIAQDLFGHFTGGWELAIAIRDWVHDKVAFNYKSARSTKTAMDVFTERIGVCRDFQHLALTLTRCMNIPARYVTGQLGDIRMPAGGPGDFSAWYQVFLGGRWWDMDARHNDNRLGRILMATGRDAADVAITTSFGRADLTHFYVESNEVDANGQPVPLPPRATLDKPIA